jgi:hypothetical protein
MTQTVWTKKQCDWILLGVLALILVLASALYLSWYNLMSGYQEIADDARHRTALYLRVAERKETAQSELESSKLKTLIQQNYLTGEAPGVAYANLQQKIKEVINTAGGVALSTQLVQEPQDEQRAAEKIIVRVRMQGDSYALQKMVEAIEAKKPLLFFEKLSISAPAKIKSDSVERLDISFDVYGYFWNEASS